MPRRRDGVRLETECLLMATRIEKAGLGRPAWRQPAGKGCSAPNGMCPNAPSPPIVVARRCHILYKPSPYSRMTAKACQIPCALAPWCAKRAWPEAAIRSQTERVEIMRRLFDLTNRRHV